LLIKSSAFPTNDEYTVHVAENVKGLYP